MDDVIEQFDMAKSTAYGYLFTLEKSGLLVKHGPEYVLGLQLLHLGECAKSRNKYYPLARKYVFQIADELGEGATESTLTASPLAYASIAAGSTKSAVTPKSAASQPAARNHRRR